MTLSTSLLPLTVIDQRINEQAARTYPGQAHFAGSGPLRATCLQCAHWGITSPQYHAKNGKHFGAIKPAPCAKFRSLTQQVGPSIPDGAEACRHFEENFTPPPRIAR